MKKMSETIVFFGSGPVAAESLKFISDIFEIEAVITKATPLHHKVVAPVETVARNKDLKIYFSNTKDELDSLIDKLSLKSKLGIIVDFGVIVTGKTIKSFPLGIINSHFSLLPQWRGADPITFSILSGQTKTGVSLMLIEPTLDTGKLIAQRSLPISPDDTTPTLTDKLISLSNELIATFVPRYMLGEIKPRKQSHPDRATYSRKLSKNDGKIDWVKPAQQLEREIRAYFGWPGSRTTLLGKEVIITKAHYVPVDHGEPGTVEIINNGIISVNCGSGYLCIEKLKPAGKREMTSPEFVRGYNKL